MNMRLLVLLALLSLILASCIVEIDPIKRSVTPRITSVTLNGSGYSLDSKGQPQSAVVSNASNVFVVQAQAQDFTSLVINVLHGTREPKAIFATITCSANDPQPCSLTLPTQAQWKPEDKGYYDISVKAFNTNSSATREFPKWLLVFLE